MAAHVHTYHLIPINTIVCELVCHTAAPQLKGCLLFAHCGSSLETFKFIPIIPLDSNTQRRLHYFASHNMVELPQFLHLHSKAPAGLPPCVRPILQHTVVPISTSTKPSANLLANSFCYPTITPQAPWIPGTRPISGTVLKKKRHRC